MLGYETVKAKSRSKNKNGSSESVSEQRRALMLPQEIRELGRWTEIVSLENCRPIKCDKIKYFEDPAFTTRLMGSIREDVPVIDVSRHIAKIEGRVRDISEEEQSGEAFVTASLNSMIADSIEQMDRKTRSMAEQLRQQDINDITAKVAAITGVQTEEKTRMRLAEIDKMKKSQERSSSVRRSSRKSTKTSRMRRKPRPSPWAFSQRTLSQRSKRKKSKIKRPRLEALRTYSWEKTIYFLGRR